jgi:hypothetical protein
MIVFEPGQEETLQDGLSTYGAAATHQAFAYNRDEQAINPARCYWQLCQQRRIVWGIITAVLGAVQIAETSYAIGEKQHVRSYCRG